jgi:hypothetical protein
MLEYVLSAGLGGDGVAESRPLLSEILFSVSFLPGPLFSAKWLSKLGRRLEATERFRESESLQAVFSGGSLRGATSTRLGSVSSRISDNGRVLVAQGGSPAVTQAEPFSNCKSPIALLTIFSRAGIAGGREIRGGSLTLSLNEFEEGGGPLPGGGGTNPDQFSI